MSSDRELCPRLHRLNQRDVLDLVGQRLVEQGRRLVDSAMVTSVRAEGDTLCGRVRDKPGQTGAAIKLRLPDGHPALAFTLEIVEAPSLTTPPVLSNYEAALLLYWAQSQNRVYQGVVIGSAGPQAIDLAAPKQALSQSDWLDALTQIPANALWQGMRGPYGDLAALLLQQRVSDVRRMAKRLSIRSAGESKETLLPQMVPALLRPETIRQAVDSLAPVPRALLALLLLRDSGMSPHELNETAKRLRLVEAENGFPGIVPQVSDALKNLHTAALVLADDPSSEYVADHQVPRDIIAQYDPSLTDLPGTQIGSVGADEVTPAPTSTDLLAVLRGLVLALHARPWKSVAPSPITDLERSVPMLRGWRNDAQELAEIRQRKTDVWRWHYDSTIKLAVCPPPPLLHDNDVATLARDTASTPEMVRFLLRLLEAMDLLMATPPTLVLTGHVNTLLTRPVEEQRHVLATAWAYMSNWSDVHDLDGIQVRRTMVATSNLRPDQLYAEMAAARRFVLRLLRMLTPDRWYSLADIVALVRLVHPHFLFEQRGGHQSMAGDKIWWLHREGGRHLSPKRDADWEYAEARLIQHWLTGPLCWLGMLQAGGAQAEYVRITAAGAYLLGLGGPPEHQPARQVLHITDEPDMARMSVRLGLSDATPAVLHTLGQIAQVDGLNNGNLVYTITPQQLRDGLMRGQSVDNIQDFMRQHAHDPLPDTALARLEQWGAGFGQATIYTRMTLIELADDLLLPELRRSTRLERALLEQLSPRLLLVDPASADALFDELVAKGYTPRRMSSP